MEVYFGIWRVETTIQPQDPKMAMQLYQAFASQIKHDLESGDLKESHSFLEGNGGYFVSGDISDERLHQILMIYQPYVTFEVHQTVPILETIENLIAISKERAVAMSMLT